MKQALQIVSKILSENLVRSAYAENEGRFYQGLQSTFFQEQNRDNPLCRDSTFIITSNNTSTMDTNNSPPSDIINIIDLPNDGLQGPMAFLCARDQDALAESNPKFVEALSEKYGLLASLPFDALKLVHTFMEANDQHSFGLTCKRCEEAIVEAMIAPCIQNKGYCLLKQRVSSYETIPPLLVHSFLADVSYNRRQSSRFLLQISRKGTSGNALRLSVDKLIKSNAIPNLNHAFLVTAHRKNEAGVLQDVGNDVDMQKLVGKFLIDYGVISLTSNISFDGGNNFTMIFWTVNGLEMIRNPNGNIPLNGRQRFLTSLHRLANAGHIIQNPNGTVALAALP